MRTSKFKFEIIFVLLLGIFALFAPVVIKTKSLSYLIAPHALLIVIGGTLCAGCMSFSCSKILRAFKALKSLLIVQNKQKLLNLSDEIIEIAKIARANGHLALAETVDKIENPFLKKAVKNLSLEPDVKTFEDELRFMVYYQNKNDFENVDIFEELGGFAPTFGMLGAVIGLIQISALSSDPKSLLSGIATAFIATIYGVGAANLFFIPVAKKLKSALETKLLEQEIVISSILDIAQYQSSIIVSEKLDRILLENDIVRKGKILEFAA